MKPIHLKYFSNIMCLLTGIALFIFSINRIRNLDVSSLKDWILTIHGMYIKYIQFFNKKIY